MASSLPSVLVFFLLVLLFKLHVKGDGMEAGGRHFHRQHQIVVLHYVSLFHGGEWHRTCIHRWITCFILLPLHSLNLFANIGELQYIDILYLTISREKVTFTTAIFMYYLLSTIYYLMYINIFLLFLCREGFIFLPCNN
jgi:hypothetical protein